MHVAVQWLREKRSILNHPTCQGKPSGSNATVMPEEVLACTLPYMHSNTSKISQLCNLMHHCVWEILHAEDSHPYHNTSLQALLSHDNE